MAGSLQAYFAHLRAQGGVINVMLPPSQYAAALEETRRTGSSTLDFRDEMACAAAS